MDFPINTVIPIKSETSVEYFYHLIGSFISYKYIVAEGELWTYLCDKPIKKKSVYMTFKEFNTRCLKTLMNAIKKEHGAN